MLENYDLTIATDTRSGFGKALHELGNENNNVVALCADLTGSLKMTAFEKDFPERFFNVGIAEANMMGVAAGLSLNGKIPYTGTFANFSTGRVYDQIRQSIAYSHKNVKICASHAGITLGEDGATHQILEDIGMMRMLPGMTVVVPCDFNQTYLATKAIAKIDGPVYLRFGRPKVPNFTSLDDTFEIGKAQIIESGSDVTIVACGHLVWKAIEAALELKSEGISCEIINMHTIKPFDAKTLIKSIDKTGCVVSAEEHQKNGGLGDCVAQVLVEQKYVPQEYVAVDDSFGESGKPMQLMEKYKIDNKAIVSAVKKVIQRKNAV